MPGGFQEEVHRGLGHIPGHQLPLPLEIPGGGKAITAAQIAVVGHVQAEGLHHGSGPRRNLGEIRAEKKPLINQFQNLAAHLLVAGMPLQKGRQVFPGCDPGASLNKLNQLQGQLIQNMHRCGVAVHREMQTALAVNMYTGLIQQKIHS